jgi:hypothetical protein
MMRKVGIAAKKLPSGLFITGVHSCDKYPTFSGGFADVYRAWYNGEMVALKRIRTFQSRPEREHLVLTNTAGGVYLAMLIAVNSGKRLQGGTSLDEPPSSVHSASLRCR